MIKDLEQRGKKPMKTAKTPPFDRSHSPIDASPSAIARAILCRKPKEERASLDEV